MKKNMFRFMLLMGSSILLGCGGASTEVTEVAYVEEVVESSVGETIIEEEIIEEVPDLEVQPMETVMFGYVSEQKEIFSSDTISINTNLEKMCLQDGLYLTIPIEVVNTSDYKLWIEISAVASETCCVSCYHKFTVDNDGLPTILDVEFCPASDATPENLEHITMDFYIGSDDCVSVLELEPVIISDLVSNNPTVTNASIEREVEGDCLLVNAPKEELAVVESVTSMTSDYPTVRVGNDQSGYYDHPIIGEYAITPFGEEVRINGDESYLSNSITVGVEVTAHDRIEQYANVTLEDDRGYTLTNPYRDYDEFGNVIYETGASVVNGMETLVMTTRYDNSQSCCFEIYFNTESKYVNMRVSGMNITTEQFVEAVNVVMSSYSFGSFPMGFYQTQICMP